MLALARDDAGEEGRAAWSHREEKSSRRMMTRPADATQDAHMT